MSEGMKAQAEDYTTLKAAGLRIKKGWEPDTGLGRELSLFTR